MRRGGHESSGMQPSQMQQATPRCLARELQAGANQIITLCWQGQIKPMSALLLENIKVFKRLDNSSPT